MITLQYAQNFEWLLIKFTKSNQIEHLLTLT